MESYHLQPICGWALEALEVFVVNLTANALWFDLGGS
jgi:hypothetical protein